MSLKTIRKERARLKEILLALENGVPMTNAQGSPRAIFVGDMIVMAGLRHPFNADLVKAALELYAYNDRAAKALLQSVVEYDYKRLIREKKSSGKK